jgi:formate dehydrogenase maturation protein FdhE
MTRGPGLARADSGCKVAADCASADNPIVATTPWQRRIERAESLARQHPFAREILSFYSSVARFQEGLYRQLAGTADKQKGLAAGPTAPPELPFLIRSFGGFLSVVGEHGPARLTEAARELHGQAEAGWSQLLNDSWLSSDTSPAQPAQFLARAFLQPYAEWLRSRAALNWQNYTYPLCPFCHRKPGAGVLRQQGEGARRCLMCSFCLAEWDFRRIVCPACGEEENTKLPVYTADEFDYIRVECCDTCKTYIKSINLTRNGLAEPIVDEMASAPLDLWARDHGYAKLELNLIGM